MSVVFSFCGGFNLAEKVVVRDLLEAFTFDPIQCAKKMSSILLYSLKTFVIVSWVLSRMEVCVDIIIKRWT